MTILHRKVLVGQYKSFVFKTKGERKLELVKEFLNYPWTVKKVSNMVLQEKAIWLAAGYSYQDDKNVGFVAGRPRRYCDSIFIQPRSTVLENFVRAQNNG